MPTIRCLYARPSDEIGQLADISMPVNTEDAQFPATLLCNWTNEHQTTPAKAAAAGAATWHLLYGSPAQTIEGILLWHNFDAAITVHFTGSNDGFATTPLDVSIVVPARMLDGFARKLFYDLREEAGFGSYEAYRVVVPSASVAAGLKLMAFGTLREFEAVNVLTEPRRPNSERSIILSTDFGFEWVYRLFAPRQGLLCSMLPTAQDLADLRAWFQDAGGPAQVVFFLLESDINDPIIGRLNAEQADGLVTSRLDPALYYQHSVLHTVSFGITELTAGLPEWE